MKKILITGANSYVGTSFDKYLSQWPDEYSVDTLDMVDEAWKNKSFAGYDSVFHVAGIAHQDSGQISEEKRKLYYAVNYHLAVETAERAKVDGVHQFIFMSTMSVYGENGSIKQRVIITKDTKAIPKNFYGKSKLRAEEAILRSADDAFSACILRPPMIYGPDCKGNYPRLAKAALRLPLFPDVESERSMLFIENLCVYIKAVVDGKLSGIHFPQNAEYVSTSDMVREIAMAHGKNIKMTKVFNPLLRFLSGKVDVVDKVFGSLVYDKRLSELGQYGYPAISFDESIRRTETVY